MTSRSFSLGDLITAILSVLRETAGGLTMGRHRKNLSGLKFGRLDVLSEFEQRGTFTFWKCQCECGEVTWVRSNSLTTGNTQSCGCLREDRLAEIRRTQWGLAITIAGRTLNLKEWVAVYHQVYSLAYRRITELSWSPLEALTTPKGMPPGVYEVEPDFSVLEN